MGCPVRSEPGADVVRDKALVAGDLDCGHFECIGGSHGVEQQAQDQGQPGGNPTWAQVGKAQQRSAYGSAAEAESKIVAFAV